MYRDGGDITIDNSVKVVNVFDDIERDIRLLTVDAAPVSGIQADGHAQSVDATQPG